MELAITGLACRYPGASTPRGLWTNVLARRPQFRRFLDQRMPAADYHSADPSAPDRTYGRLGAFLDGFAFDPAARRIPRSTVECTDIVHWLALDVAAAALIDAGHPEGEGLPRARTSVIVGNSLTGEHTRATSLRLRWPYVERTVREAAIAAGVADPERLIAEARARFLAAFPPITEDTLAGGLSNTIAGRICGAFDFGAGGYTVDGACASSLLAVCTAASALEAGRADLVLAGGVDVSLDPFELVGFAKTRALTPTEMRVYDRRGNGFVPGEGCGFVVLERLDDALAAGRRPYAVLRGWGISSDGRNAITAPRVSGQARAVSAAWARGGVPDFVEGHGTGTAVGDRVELEALAVAAGDGPPRRIAVTSLKSIVGHTKAAAGVGALLKAVAAVNRRVIPPTSGCEQPNPVFDAEARALYPAMAGEVRDPATPLVAGVSAMGFGGINSHVVVASHGAPDPRLAPDLPEARLVHAAQTAELFVFAAPDRAALAEQVRRVRALAAGLAAGELPDLSAALAAEVSPAPVRAAVVAHTPEALVQRLDRLEAAADADGPEVWVGAPTHRARIGFLCPGQGSQDLRTAAAALARDDGLRSRADALCAVAAEAGCPDLWDAAHPPERVDPAEARARLANTALAQPALLLATWVWASRLAALGLSPDVVGGHSLGELSAFAVAGALDPATAMRAAVARGRAMAAPADRPAGMTSLATDPDTAAALCAEVGGLVVANVNAPRQVVVAGARAALDAVAERAAGRGIPVRPLPVTNAFHSPWVAAAAGPVRDALPVRGAAPRCELWSSRSDQPIGDGCDLAEHFAAHLVEPVDFVAHARRIGPRCDLWIEVGPGRVLSGLAEACGVGPCLPVEGSPGRDDWLAVLAAAWVRGVDVAWHRLHDGRPVAPVVPASERTFWTNPCEVGRSTAPAAAEVPSAPAPAAEPLGGDVLTALIDEVTARTGFDRSSVTPDHRLRDELNLDSIKAGEIVATVARRAGVADRVDPAQLASHPLTEIARALVDAGATATPATPAAATPPRPAAARWVRSFVTRTVPAEPARGSWTGRRVAAVGPEHVLPALVEAGAIADPHTPDVVVTSIGDGPPHDQVRALRACVDTLGPSVRTWIVVQRAGGSLGVGDPGRGLALASFARSVSLERPQLAIAALDLADDVDASVIVDHLPVTPGFTGVGIDRRGCRRVEAEPAVPGPAANTPAAGELVVVTGGARGITRACAFALARRTGVRLALIGATPADALDDDAALALGRAAIDGIDARYFAADLTDEDQVRAAIDAIERRMGPIAAVIHGAGRNTPRRVEATSAADAAHEIGPKWLGARHLLGALRRPPRWIVGLTSIIGVTGMQGNAWYAFANENLDLELARYAAAHPGTRATSVAFGVWDEVGMGARLGAVEGLARLGIGSLRPDVGAERFVAAACGDAGARQVIVTAHVDGLPTWPSPARAEPGHRWAEGGRGVRGVDFTRRLHLDPTAQPWLADHVFRGSTLLPTVFGLEMMAQAAVAARGGGAVSAVEDVGLATPVVVGPGGAEIELRAVVDEHDPCRVYAEVRTEQTGFAKAHFRATVQFRPAPLEPVALPTLPPPATPLDPRVDLYGGLLFQGPSFQRMGPIRGAAPGAVRFGGEVTAPERWALGDPFFRDALLQAGQLLIPHDDALPVSIARWAIDGAAEPGAREVLATLDATAETTRTGTVTAVDAAGRVRERIDGYVLAVLAHHPDRPGLAEILDPSLAAAPLADRVAATLRARGWPSPSLGFLFGPLGTRPLAERREAEAALVARVSPGAALGWRADGSPSLADGRPVSVSHDPGACVVAIGVAGVDLEGVAPRDWGALLGPRSRVLPGDDVDGTRVWAATEALFKAGARAPSLTAGARDGDVVPFDAIEGDQRWEVLTCTLRLPRGPARVLAVARRASAPAAVAWVDPDAHRVRLVRGAPDRMETRFVASFDDASGADGYVPAHVLATWMGRLRELALAGVRGPLREHLATGRVGMVTQSARVERLGDAGALDGIEATTWVEELLPTTCALGFAFDRLGPDGPVRVGIATQRFAWVEITGHGTVRGAPFPAYLQSFLGELAAARTLPPARAIGLPTGPVLARGAFDTGTLDGNAVGNVYYANYFRWPARVLDQWLYEQHRAWLAPGHRGRLTVASTAFEFLRESMPFDPIEVALHLERQDGPELELGVQFTRAGARLAVGRIRAAFTGSSAWPALAVREPLRPERAGTEEHL